MQVYYRNSNTFIFSQFCLNSQLKSFKDRFSLFDTIPAEYYAMLPVAVPNKSRHTYQRTAHNTGSILDKMTCALQDISNFHHFPLL